MNHELQTPTEGPPLIAPILRSLFEVERERQESSLINQVLARKENHMATSMKPITVLKTFFGLKPGQTMAEFLREVRELSQDEKIELAKLAAAQMGVELDESPA